MTWVAIGILCTRFPSLGEPSIAQDRWGRQRGGRKARWDKLDRTPPGIKGSLSALGSSPEHLIHDPFDVVSPVGKSSATVSAYSSEAEEDDDVPQSTVGTTNIIGDESLKSPSPRGHQERTQPRSAEKTPPSVEASFSTPKGPGGETKERKAMMGAATLPLRGSNMGGMRGRRSLRSPASASLSRTSSSLLESGSGPRLGAFRGSPPPLHKRFSAPGSAERGGASVSAANRGGKLSRKGRQRQHSVLQKARSVDSADAGNSAAARTPGQESRKQQVREGRSWGEEASLDRDEGSDEEEHSRTPPMPPNLFESAFKNKLPSLTPRKAPPVTPRCVFVSMPNRFQEPERNRRTTFSVLFYHEGTPKPNPSMTLNVNHVALVEDRGNPVIR